jgi:hypothetical protein
MKRNVKIGIFCLVSIILNLALSLLTYDILKFPLFLDTVFTVAIVFYLGLVPGLIVGILYNFIDVLFNLLVRGINSPTNIFFSICGAAIVIVTWLFARKKTEFQISTSITILYLLLISLISSFVTIIIGGTFDFIRFSFYDIPDSMAPIKQFTDSFVSQKFSLFAACILGQIPISMTDRIISTFAGYGVYKLYIKILGSPEDF